MGHSIYGNILNIGFLRKVTVVVLMGKLARESMQEYNCLQFFDSVFFFCDARTDTKMDRKVLYIEFADTILKGRFLILYLQMRSWRASKYCNGEVGEKLVGHELE